ncbi:crotonobetaine/carnitine-CoA ligase [Streptomyces sp. PanSC19]|uniref:class I adenylate-forming enzyme family protein n=1 Tax=Streptomyces sp. PanSC19 TaxID=1520455 RepID=UPI000F4671CB|nr:AMP-binding protein [Streptomyces sp. PanSC19]ROQ35862.1 crotonobetaine/carnitine-CoA ligase [Streptomyces sp. PanSC19]
MESATHRTIHAALDHAVATWPDAPALVFEGTTLTFSELGNAALGRLGVLQEQGLPAGEPVLVMLGNSEQSVITWLALALGGFVEVPVNTAYIGETLAHIVRDSGARTVITESQYTDRLAAAGSEALAAILVVDARKAEAGATVRPLPVTAGRGEVVRRDELADTAVMYTSGTTGLSKGAVIAERHAYEYASAVADLLDLAPGDVYYAPLPLFHIAGRWGVVYSALQRGACTVLVRRFSISSFWSDVRAHGVTATFLLGAMAQFVLNQPVQSDDAENPLDRVLMVPLIEGVDEFRSRFDVRVTTCFGSTEANVPIASSWDASLRTGLGRLRPGYRIRLVDDQGHDVRPGAPGEMLLATDEDGLVLRRYHGNAEATQAALRDGWLHTGDVLRQDARGNLHFVDRTKDALRKRGENISSFEVEREIRSHPAVLECAVVGVASDFSEQEIVAFVQTAPGHRVTADEIRAHVAERAPKFLVPDHVRFVTEFPVTPTGKIQKFELRKQIGADTGQGADQQ